MKQDIEYPESPKAMVRRLRSLRNAWGKSQAEMAKLLGSRSQSQLWGNYESDKPGAWKRISVDNALKLCHKTGVTLDWIYRGDVRLLSLELSQKLIAAEASAGVKEDGGQVPVALIGSDLLLPQ